MMEVCNCSHFKQYKGSSFEGSVGDFSCASENLSFIWLMWITTTPVVLFDQTYQHHVKLYVLQL